MLGCVRASIMKRDIGAELSLSPVIIYPLITCSSPLLSQGHWHRGCLSPRRFFGVKQWFLALSPSLLMAYKQMLMFSLVFFKVLIIHRSQVLQLQRVSSGVKTLITALAQHREIIYFANTRKIPVGWD